MNLFFDTSALIKHYIQETGSSIVDELMDQTDNIIVSSITEIEAHSTFRRLFTEKAIDAESYRILKTEFEKDWKYFTQINFDTIVSKNAKVLIEKYQLKTLDSIQLATVLSVTNQIDAFIVCDNKLISCGKKEKLEIINPNIKI